MEESSVSTLIIKSSLLKSTSNPCKLQTLPLFATLMTENDSTLQLPSVAMIMTDSETLKNFFLMKSQQASYLNILLLKQTIMESDKIEF